MNANGIARPDHCAQGERHFQFGQATAFGAVCGQATGLAVDAAGDVSVVDACSNELLRFEADGTFVER